MTRKLLFSVTIGDCKVETFTCGGHGGAGKDTSNNGVRVTHPPSGATGKSCDHRSQLENKRAAFKRMATDYKFLTWVREEVFEAVIIDEAQINRNVDRLMAPENIATHTRDEYGDWHRVDENWKRIED